MTKGAAGLPDLSGLLEAMFQTDGRGRLVGSAPSFHLLRTPQNVICRFHADLADEVVLLLEGLARRERGRPAQWQYEYGDHLSALAAPNLRVAAMRAGPLYTFPDGLAPSGACTAIEESNSHLLRNGLEEWLPDVATGQPLIAAVDGNRAVAVCATVNASRTAHCAAVETLAAYRGRGFAAAAVAGWACAVRALGTTPFYGTTFANLSSQALPGGSTCHWSIRILSTLSIGPEPALAMLGTSSHTPTSPTRPRSPKCTWRFRARYTEVCLRLDRLATSPSTCVRNSGTT